MKVGYARTSTAEQSAGLAAQINELEALGVEKVFSEQVSSVGRRQALQDLLEFIREGDLVIVTKLDRLARSVANLLEIVEALKSKGAELRIASMDLDTSTATGKLMLSILGSVAEFEREIMLERQREGIAKAKAEGKYKGRAPTAQKKASRVLELLASGETEQAVADQLNISRSSVQRIKRNSSENVRA